MATTKQTKTFIEKIAPLICAEASARGYNYPSGMIAQAIHESGVTSKLATKYFNLFGMKTGSSWKGKAVSLDTTEYYEGVPSNVKAAFRAYDSLEEGIKGYFEFLQYSRYQIVKAAISGYNYCERIYDAGWATGPRASYLQKCKYYIETYNLTQYDTPRAETSVIGTFQITAEPSLRIRREPSILSEQTGSLKKGETIAPYEMRMYADGSIWCRIEQGWVCRRLNSIYYMI